MPESMRAIQTGSDRTHEPIDGPRQPSRAEPIAPIQKIVLRGVFELQIGEGILVALVLGIEAKRRLEWALGLLGGVRPVMAPQVGQIRLQRCKHRIRA